MEGVGFIISSSPAYRQAPEFRYLRRWVRNEIAQVWDDIVDLENLALLPQGIPILIIDERCLVGRRSLAVMRRAVEAGAPFVFPRRLGDSGLPGLDSIRTLRGIERAEGQVLAGQWAGPDPAGPPWPALLVDADRSHRLQGHHPAAILGSAPDGEVPVPVGLCHQFIDYYGEARADIVPFIERTVRDVLEVGCGRGATGALLQKRLGCSVTGVELNPVVARHATDVLHRVIVGDVLEVDVGGPYDAVVACELFEHLIEQERFLERLCTWLHPGGKAVLSIPNVGHATIVEDLLAGRWDYLPIGLLCHTHYRFFTKKTLEDWIAAAGFWNFTIIPQKTELPTWVDRLPPDLDVDRESLSASGFYVIIEL